MGTWEDDKRTRKNLPPGLTSTSQSLTMAAPSTARVSTATASGDVATDSSDLLLHPSYHEHHLYATKAASRRKHLKDGKSGQKC